jgi:amidohydrolase
LRLVLQPAEESVPGGAVDLVASGVMHDVEAAFALHADPSLAVGSIGVSAGPITSAADQIEVLLRGPGGHTGRPHQTVDLVNLAARVVTDLPAGLGRMSDPRDGLNLTFGSIQAGDAPNVIPTEAVVQGSLRCTGRATWDAAPARIQALLAGLLDPFGVDWELTHRRGAPPIENDPWAVRMVERAAVAVVGAADVFPTEQSAGGEDFSWYGEHAPVGYVRLGVRGPRAPRVDLHAGTFDIDEQAVALGARLLAGAALEAMADLGPA